MHSLTRRDALKSLLAGAALGGTLSARLALADSGMKMTPMSRRKAAPAQQPAAPDIVFHGAGFEPMVSHVTAGGRIELISAAAATLHIASAPSAPEHIRHSVAPSGRTALHFTKPGLYLLYDAATTRFDEKVGQVVAKRDAPQFPLPAYAVVLVTTPNGRGLATTSARVHIPDSYMTFQPWAIVVNAGEKISFTNNDQDLHMLMPSPEPMIMPGMGKAGAHASSALWLEHMQSFAPITLKGNGGKGVLTISQPGLHHYYCPVHAAYDTTAYTFAPLKSFGGYPFIMDGVIVVMPT